MAALMAKELGFGKEESENILHAAPMHDIGKIGIPDKVLLKPGKLDEEEWTIMKQHTTIGGHILEGDDSDLLRLAREIALTHHERWDGTGYPRGLQGEDIPLSGRIVSLADVFDALTSVRPYKKAWKVEEAVAFIQENRGSQFDPNLVDLFEKLLPEILQIRNRFMDEDN
jgi:putative two-component system response regulator